jgi:UDP-N-acetylglucosamine 2-epimerase (non-hydrolysing)
VHMKLISVVGARPNFMKIAPIVDAIFRYNSLAANNKRIEHILVHTGQHYDSKMSKLFFDDLKIPKPDINLEVGSASHAEQTAEIMKRFEKVCIHEKPTHILVVGDVNSTIACALVAVKLGIKVIHVEAGLRSFDRTMPEEINRVLTDAISDILFITEESAKINLIREGVPESKINFVGNVMIDTLLAHKERAKESKVLHELKLMEQDHLKGSSCPVSYGVLTLHRPSNVDDRVLLKGILDAVKELSSIMPVIFPVHPRTSARVHEFGLMDYFIEGNENLKKGIKLIEPLGYLDFLLLTANAKIILTDSGGIQEEATVLNVPCVTLRENTERPVTVEKGTNIIAGTNKERIILVAKSHLNEAGNKKKRNQNPPLWDGKAADRIVAILSAIE